MQMLTDLFSTDYGLMSLAVIVFLIGLISEQITSLTYRRDA